MSKYVTATSESYGRMKYIEAAYVRGLHVMCMSDHLYSPSAHLPAALPPAYTADLSLTRQSAASQRTEPIFTQLTASLSASSTPSLTVKIICLLCGT